MGVIGRVSRIVSAKRLLPSRYLNACPSVGNRISRVLPRKSVSEYTLKRFARIVLSPDKAVINRNDRMMCCTEYNMSSKSRNLARCILMQYFS